MNHIAAREHLQTLGSLGAPAPKPNPYQGALDAARKARESAAPAVRPAPFLDDMSLADWRRGVDAVFDTYRLR